MVDAQKMRDLADLIKKDMPGHGFSLIVFPFGQTGIVNYISNANRQDMIKCFEGALELLKSNTDLETPESN